MSDLYWLTDEQMARLEPYFPKSHGKPRVDDRRVLSGIIFVNRNGLRWRDAPKDYGPHKTLYNRWKRWGDKGVFLRIMEGLAAPQASERKTVMIDATYLKAHRTASSLAVKNVWPAPFASRILRCSDQSASTYAVSREHPVAKMDIRTSGATIREPATGAIFLPGLSRRRSTVRPSSRSFLQTSLGYARRSTQPIRYAAAG